MAGSADGTGAAARFSEPEAVSLDGSGNLYISERSNQTVRKLVLATGLVSTIAGSPGIAGSVDGFQIYKTSVYRRSVRMPDVAED